MAHLINYLCRFALAHEGRMCCRVVTLDFFDEDPCSGSCDSECCDVCSGEHNLKDYQGEIVSIIKAAQEIPGYGEVKVRLHDLFGSLSVNSPFCNVCITYNISESSLFLGMQLAQWIRGSCTKAIQNLVQARPEAQTYGVGRQFGHSEEGWRRLIQAAWINGFLERRMIHGAGVGLSKTTAMNTIHPVLKSEEFLSSPQPVLLPELADNPRKPAPQSSSSPVKAVAKRNGRGCRAKPIITSLISNPSVYQRGRLLVKGYNPLKSHP